MEKSVLLIGGAGYIGPVITANLLNSNAKVTCLDLLLYENKKSIENFLTDENYSFIHGDLSDFSLINPILKGITDVVILAGLVGDPITKKYPKESKFSPISQQIIKTGAGTELKKLLGKIGIKASPSCSCNKRVIVMDNNGIEWCENNIDTIIEWLKEEATKRKLPFIDMAGRMLVKKAISNAKKNAQ